MRKLLTSLAIATVAATAMGAEVAIHQVVDFAVPPQQIYEALLNEKQFSVFSGTAAQISREAGGAFSLIGGAVTGRNIELIPDTRIVQAWRVQAWPAGMYSIVRFELMPNGSGTRVVFDQTGFPPQDWQALSANWPRKYWDPLRDYLEKFPTEM